MTVILIVEDELFTCMAAELALEDRGHQVLSASDVHTALLLLQPDQRIDALFTDIYLKSEVFGGCRLAQQARTLRPHLPVLYTTGNAINADLTAKFVEGSRLLSKPYTPDELRDAVDGLIAAQVVGEASRETLGWGDEPQSQSRRPAEMSSDQGSSSTQNPRMQTSPFADE